MQRVFGELLFGRQHAYVRARLRTNVLAIDPAKPRVRDSQTGKLMVVELDDDVEVILSNEAVADVVAGRRITTAARVIDRAPVQISTRRIRWSIQMNGVVDYVDDPDSNL